MRYWDTSALVKLFAWEPDSPRFRELAARRAPLATSEITMRELFLTLCRKESAGDIKTQATEAIFERIQSNVASGRIILLPLNEAIDMKLRALALQLHRSSPPVLLRTLDAIHLATVQQAGVEEILTTDARMAEAARILGFRVYP